MTRRPDLPVATQMRGVTDLPPPIPFDTLRSRCPVAGFTAAHRADPYYHGLWMGGAQTSWLTRGAMWRMERDGIGIRPHREADYTPTLARRELWTNRRDTRLAAAGAVHLWRTLTAQQLAAVTGNRAAAREDFMAPAFHAGLVERGTFLHELAGPGDARHNRLYRPGTVEAFDKFADELDYHQRIGVTAGQPWTGGGQYDRHNVLATELALRVAEYCDVATVLGELLARLDLLSTDTRRTEHSTADAVLVRPDGHRIAIELTASYGENTGRKIDKWARILSDVDTRRIGLSVVFVDAVNPDRPRKKITAAYRALRSAVGRAALGTADAVRRGVPRRMAVARWQEWFPAARSCSTAFLTLAASRPTGPHTQRWQPVNLLDPFDLEFAPADPDAGQPLIRNSRHLLGVPAWMRENTPPVFYSSALLAHAGVGDPIDPAPRETVRTMRRDRQTAANQLAR